MFDIRKDFTISWLHSRLIISALTPDDRDAMLIPCFDHVVFSKSVVIDLKSDPEGLLHFSASARALQA